jgi:carbonic anhydrase
MHNVIERVNKFYREAYPKHRALFARLARNREPAALFITCSDSRVVPNLFLQADPGELFLIRNAGNIVPPAGSVEGGTVASIEYAVVALHVKDVIICGHSDCGAMKGILHPETVSHMPAVARWVEHAKVAREAVHQEFPGLDDATVAELLVDYNVIAQVRNLLTHSFIRERVEAGNLDVYGWAYDIRTGMIRGMDESGRNLIPLDSTGAGSPDEKSLLASLQTEEEFWSRL